MISLYIKKIGDVWFGVACDEREIFTTSFASDKEGALRSLLSGIPCDVSFQQFEKPSAFAERVMAALKNVYDGKDTAESFHLAIKHLSRYFRRVIEVVSLIPVGYVASYGAVAKTAGGSPRAVGRVMASNPYAPIVPCHRVVSSDFTLCGYGGGLDAKLAFLNREKRGYTTKKEISVKDKKVLVFPVEFVLSKVGKREGKALK